MTERSKPNRENKANIGIEPGESQLTGMEAEIDQTRTAISGDLRTLGERLSPDHLKEEAKGLISEAKGAAVETLHEAKDAATSAFREAKDSAMESVSAKVDEFKGNVRRVERQTMGFLRDNAVPLAFIGIGVAWFMSNRRSREASWDREYRWGARGEAARGYRGDWEDSSDAGVSGVKERGRDLATQTNNRAQQWVEGAEHKVTDVAERARSFAKKELEGAQHMARDAGNKVSEAATQARDFAGRELRQARDFSKHAAEAHPLAVGAAALAAGIGVGLVLPQTRREGALLGPARDQLVGEAKEIIEDWGHAAGDTARDVKQSLSGARP